MASLFTPKQIELGEGSINKLADFINDYDTVGVFVIMDAFLDSPKMNYRGKIDRILHKKKIHSTYFSNFQGEPTTAHLKSALREFTGSGAGLVVAIGGGSALDLGKALSLFSINPQMRWEDISSYSRLMRLPLIAVPTTAGTGSESTKVMVITNSDNQLKMNPGHKDLIPDVTILDPVLTLSLPPNFTAYTGMDALTHAIEAFLSNRSTDLSDYYALYAMEKINKHLPTAYHDGGDLEARGQMLLASSYAGIAFSNASTNLAHAAGRSMGSFFHLPHGLSVALLLPFVMEYGLDSDEEKLAQIAVSLGEDSTGNRRVLAEKGIQKIMDFNSEFNIWKDAYNLIDVEEFKRSIPNLVENAMDGNGISTNKKLPNYVDIERVYYSLIDTLNKVELVRTSR